jgi:hypothetical protein
LRVDSTVAAVGDDAEKGIRTRERGGEGEGEGEWSGSGSEGPADATRLLWAPRRATHDVYRLCVHSLVLSLARGPGARPDRTGHWDPDEVVMGASRGWMRPGLATTLSDKCARCV